MSCYVGPKISNSGLVFHYDMSNTSKSWKGAPTTNLWSYSQAFSNWNKTASITITDNNIISPLGDLTASKITASGAGGSYINLSGTFTSGNTYTKSAYAKAGSTPTLVFESYDNNGSGGTAYFPTTFNLLNGTYTTSPGDTATMSYITDGWYRCTVTRTYSLTVGSGTFYIGAYGAGVGFLYLWGAQAELGSFATPLVTTAGSTASRANTQVLLDLTNQNTITATSLTYAGNNTFSFTGTNSISIPSINFSQSQTIEIWLQPLENDATRRNPYNQAYGGYGTWTHEPSGAFNYYYGDAGSNTTPYVGHGSGFTVVQNEIAHIVSTRNTTTSQWYKNGVQSTSYSHPYLDLAADNNPILIGTGYAGGYIGNIFSVKLYNRALSSVEIQQNFEASRGRYGI